MGRMGRRRRGTGGAPAGGTEVDAAEMFRWRGIAEGRFLGGGPMRAGLGWVGSLGIAA